MPIVRISQPLLRSRLLAYLGEQRDVVATPGDDDGISVNIVGSYNRTSHPGLVTLRIRTWEALQHAAGSDVSLAIE